MVFFLIYAITVAAAAVVAIRDHFQRTSRQLDADIERILAGNETR